jgi:hypothetical protein
LRGRELLRQKFADVAIVAAQATIARVTRPHLVHHRYEHAALAAGGA